MSRPVIPVSAGTVPVRHPSRNQSLPEILAILQDHSARSLDVVAGAASFRASGGQLVVDGVEPALGADGVTLADGAYGINDIALTGIADKLAIPLPYLKRLSREHPDLFDANVNGWLGRTDRRFLLRLLRGRAPGNRSSGTVPGSRTPEGDGVIRAFLSDRYSVIDNLDVLMAVLNGVRASGADVHIDGGDLTERRMHLRISAPAVRAMAPRLLANYRSPFDGRAGSALPVVWAGFVITNSETGCGAFTLAPRITVEACTNGLVVDWDRIRRTHLGSQHTGDDGLLTRSTETLDRTLDLIASRTKDAVAQYLDPAYLAQQIVRLEKVAGAPVDDAAATLKVVSQRLRFSEDQQAAILGHFIRGADLSAGGVMQAITSVAQTLPDADEAHDLECAAVRAMHLAAGIPVRA